jgi:hypothetical protein
VAPPNFTESRVATDILWIGKDVVKNGEKTTDKPLTQSQAMQDNSKVS